uniref:CSON001477 protein n=1 Tax=Culicoides sonorensis TaxID=179676 RepID=A0A336MUD4_CULSO
MLFYILTALSHNLLILHLEYFLVSVIARCKHVVKSNLFVKSFKMSISKTLRFILSEFQLSNEYRDLFLVFEFNSHQDFKLLKDDKYKQVLYEYVYENKEDFPKLYQTGIGTSKADFKFNVIVRGRLERIADWVMEKGEIYFRLIEKECNSSTSSPENTIERNNVSNFASFPDTHVKQYRLRNHINESLDFSNPLLSKDMLLNRLNKQAAKVYKKYCLNINGNGNGFVYVDLAKENRKLLGWIGCEYCNKAIAIPFRVKQSKFSQWNLSNFNEHLLIHTSKKSSCSINDSHSQDTAQPIIGTQNSECN